MVCKKNIVVITGPTGSGKTDLAVAVASHFRVPVLSADSRQMYRGMAIGTAQPSAEQLQAVKHYFIASHDPADQFSAGRYEREALEVLHEVFSSLDMAVVAGGSGLYIDALCKGMDDIPDTDPDLRRLLGQRFRQEGLAPLVEELRRLDPEYAERVDTENSQRIIRALEVCLSTGRPYSSFRKGEEKRRDFGIVRIGTILPRATLYKRIDERVDQMIKAGLEEEARKFYPLRNLNSLQTVGYMEMFDYIDGTITFEKAVELIKRNSRRYAKRQLTWLGRNSSITWFSPFAVDHVIAHIDSFLVDRGPTM